jgi:hypothetical protein
VLEQRGEHPPPVPRAEHPGPEPAAPAGWLQSGHAEPRVTDRQAPVVDRSMRRYYDQRADEYDDWWLGRGLFADRDRPGWADEVGQLIDTLGGLQPAAVLDVACGTGFLTQHLRGRVADSLVVVDSALRDGVQVEEWQLRTLQDGSQHRVYKRYFRAAQLAQELGGGAALMDGRWFVAVESPGTAGRPRYDPTRAREVTR